MVGKVKDIFKDITDEEVAQATPKPARGRPKSAKRVEAEKDATRRAFIDEYESLTPRRPEPKRLVIALSLPEDQQMKALEDALNTRQLAFCREYVIDFNRAKAGVRAGYPPSSVDNTTYNLMQYRGVRRLIEIYNQTNAQKITKIDPEYVIQKVTEIVTNSPKDSDKLRGLELLARHLGMFVERTEITGKDGEAIRFEETRKEADSVARQLREMGKKTGLSVVK